MSTSLTSLFRLSAFLGIVAVPLCAQQEPRKYSQFPSPMTESTRQHPRLTPTVYEGVRSTVSGILPKPVDVFLPRRFNTRDPIDVLIHFHGAPYVVHHAAESSGLRLMVATINLGGGSRSYNDPFEDTTAFPRLLRTIQDSMKESGTLPSVRSVYLSGFSAGYGAIRRILSTPSLYGVPRGILLLDGIHASYTPERLVLAEGGRIDSTQLQTFLTFAQEASKGPSSRRFVITHSEIFPGTFVSTTEATDWILQNLQIRRRPLLTWGPLGMQQLSEAGTGQLRIMGFAGNAAQDHVDHLQALSLFVRVLFD